MTFDPDRVLVECDLDALRDFVTPLESAHAVTVLKPPSACLTMLRAADSLEHQEFFLGEAVTTECEVAVDGHPGYGVCLGDEPQRSYCLAVVDALRHAELDAAPLAVFLAQQHAVLAAREADEAALVARTLVDFKLMEQE